MPRKHRSERQAAEDGAIPQPLRQQRDQGRRHRARPRPQAPQALPFPPQRTRKVGHDEDHGASRRIDEVPRPARAAPAGRAQPRDELVARDRPARDLAKPSGGPDHRQQRLSELAPWTETWIAVDDEGQIDGGLALGLQHRQPQVRVCDALGRCLLDETQAVWTAHLPPERPQRAAQLDPAR